jgi:hypothetical protein
MTGAHKYRGEAMKKRKGWLGVGARYFLVMALACLVWSGPLAAQGNPVQEACSPSAGQSEAAQPTYQEYADLIAGNPMDATNLTKWVNPEGWREYTEDMNQVWNRYAEKHLKPMRVWATQELNPAQTGEGTVFYPFSGPDVANILALFPQAKQYLLIALEPVGSLPVLQPGKNELFYSSLENSLYALLQLNYFITQMMATDLVKKEVDGVLPLLMYFLGRENARVLKVDYWQMQADGSITEKPAKAGERLTGAGIPGVKIIFQRGEGEPEQTLYYFRFNLQDASWRSNPQFAKLLKEFGPYRTFVKAASYLMFNPQFGDIRQFVLDRSQLVLQTDEGIPLKYFEPERWERRFYGNYACPIRVFANCFQADMATMYRNGQNTKPLPFVIGYRAHPNFSNLLLASRRAIVAEEEAKRNKESLCEKGL